MRSLPAAVAIDGVRHTWTSYQRTLNNVVLGEPAAALLRKTSCTVTAVLGSNDQVCRPFFARNLAHEQPHLSLQILADVDHHPALRAPDQVARLLAAPSGASAR